MTSESRLCMLAQEASRRGLNQRGSLLDELRLQYEAVHESADERGDVESFEAKTLDAFGLLHGHGAD